MNVTSATSLTAAPPGPAGQPAAPAPVAGPETAPPATATREQLDAAVERANETINRDTGLRFAVHEATNRIVVRIVDPQSMEVIREFPDSDFLDMMAKLQELAGLQVNVRT
jgi:flagellar protein FlaG